MKRAEVRVVLVRDAGIAPPGRRDPLGSSKRPHGTGELDGRDAVPLAVQVDHLGQHVRQRVVTSGRQKVAPLGAAFGRDVDHFGQVADALVKAGQVAGRS